MHKNSTLSLFIIALMCMGSQLSMAQNKARKVVEPNLHHRAPPITLVPEKTMQKAIDVSGFHVNSEIRGNIAQTTLTIEFYNPNKRAVSADFIFPIPVNSSINGYALDINGVMVDGVAVEKHKARTVFEKIVRQGVDPGLIEKITGNVFKARIFPINSKQKRTIRIAFSSVLSEHAGSYDFQIPLMSGQLVKEFSMRIQAMNMAVKPIISSSPIAELDFSRWQNSYLSEVKKNNFTLTKPLTIQVPQLDKNRVNVGHNDQGDYYFTLNPDLMVLKPQEVLNDNSVRNLQVIWDASHSRFSADHELEYQLLEAYFQKHKNLSVELYLLRNNLKLEASFQVSKGNWNELLARLKRINYNGGTNLSTLKDINQMQDSNVIMFFTDAIHTFSKKQEVKLRSPMHVFSSDLSGDTEYAQQLAQYNNGQSFQLSSQVDPMGLVAQMERQVTQLLSINTKQGKVSGLPKTPVNQSNNRVPLSGKLESDSALLILNYGYSGKVTQSINVKISKKDSIQGDLPALIWTQQQLLQLQKSSIKNKSKIITFSQKHNLVSDFTSLIVLENLQQYVQHGIKPPQSMPKMRKDYFVETKRLSQSKKQIEHDKLQEVIGLWESRKKWWNKSFPKTVLKPKRDEEVELESVVMTGSRIIMDSEEDVAVMEMPSESPSMNKQKSKGSNLATVEITEWDPNTPYLKALKAVKKADLPSKYYRLKKGFFNSPAFYFDCAHFFFKNDEKEFGLQVLSNIAELKIQDSRLLRTMAMKLKQNNFIDLSIDSYRKVLNDRPEEPQSYRDLALALQERIVNDRSKNKHNDYAEAIELMYTIITTQWDRFQGIEVTVLMEINQLLPHLLQNDVDYTFIDEKLIQLLDLDVRVVLGWDSDMTDIDLWVIEPSGQKVTYNYMLSEVGGMFYQDYTGGYGPEEYLIHHAPKGTYTIKVHFYGNNSPELSGATTLYVDVFTNFGRSNQKKQTLTLRLENADDDYLVGSIVF